MRRSSLFEQSHKTCLLLSDFYSGFGCSVILKDENEKQPANLGGNRLENTELEKKQKILKYLFYRWKTKPRVNDLSCNLLLVNLRNVLQRMYYS